MKSLDKIVFISLSLFSSLAFSSDYYGLFHNEQTGDKQYVSLSLLMEKESAEKISYSAFVNIYLGDFKSKEYSSFFYPTVSFNLFNKELIFRVLGSDLSLVSTEFSEDSLKANVYSSVYGKIGNVELLSREQYQAQGLEGATISNLEGEYIGSCGDKPAKLGLVTYKKIEGKPLQFSYFQQYELQGQLSYKNVSLCGDRSQWCTLWTINGGSFDFIKKRLDLISSQNNIACEISGDKMSCDNNCSFERSKTSRHSPELIAVAKASEVFSFKEASGPSTTAGTALSGTYRGLVFHEYLQNYQVFEADLALDQMVGPEGSSLKMNLYSRLIWGEGLSEMILPLTLRDYKISPFKKEINLYSPEFASDIFIRMDKMSSHQIQGTLYSLGRGRIGPFILVKDLSRAEAKLLPKIKAPLMNSPKGEYQSHEFDLSLGFFHSTVPYNMSNPILPLMPKGYLWDKGHQFLKKKFELGSFDFYTGKFVFIEKDNGRFLHGEMSARGEVKLNLFSNGFATMTRDYSHQAFTKIK